MDLLTRLRGATGLKTIVGSAFFWAWLDALFMSAFFVNPETRGAMSEMAVVLIFGLSIPGFIIALVKPQIFTNILESKKILIAVTVFGSIGCLLFSYASIDSNEVLLVIGGLCGAIFMAVYQVAWGGAYCYEGSRSAMVYVAGGFACAVIIDTPLLFMIPQASAFFSASLPIISGIFLILIDPAKRNYQSTQKQEAPTLPKASYRRRYLGVSGVLLCGVILVMISFGYMQHLISFSSLGDDSTPGGTFIQMIRGLSAILMFLVLIFTPRHSSIVYRIGLLAMIAGFMMMPFLFGSNLSWVSGALLISGYTAFDLLVWVVFSQIAYTQSRSPLKTIVVLRLVAVVCYVIGTGIATLLFGDAGLFHQFASAETTLVGYLVVIAAMLIFGSEDIWVLFRGPQALVGTIADEESVQLKNLDTWLDEAGLTAREKDIATFLARGRTRSWIAGQLNISENTVGTHIRHIYQKTGVHNREEFIDMIASPLLSADSQLSPKSGDKPSSLTEAD